MTDKEYQDKKRECWEEFKRTNLDGEVQWQPVNRYDVFCAAFDRAYALGKQEKDAEGEEMQTCEKSKAMQLYSHLLDLVENECMSEHYFEWCDLEREYIALFGENVFADYFGSKCLPDAREVNFASKKPQPAEPKFNLGDKAILKGYVCTITSIVYEQGKFVGYKIESPLLHGIATVPESDLEPYSEPVGTKDDTKGNTKGPTFTDDCSSQCKSQDFSTIVKDSFRNERRLNIAAQIVASMVGSDDWSTWRGGFNKEIWHNMAKSSLEIADALLAEVEKKGDEE